MPSFFLCSCFVILGSINIQDYVSSIYSWATLYITFTYPFLHNFWFSSEYISGILVGWFWLSFLCADQSFFLKLLHKTVNLLSIHLSIRQRSAVCFSWRNLSWSFLVPLLQTGLCCACFLLLWGNFPQLASFLFLLPLFCLGIPVSWFPWFPLSWFTGSFLVEHNSLLLRRDTQKIKFLRPYLFEFILILFSHLLLSWA